MEGTLILGLHFGHDAHACVFSNGDLTSYVHRERISGFKHHAGLNRECISKCIHLAGVSPSDITHIAITNTQYKTTLISGFDNFI